MSYRNLKGGDRVTVRDRFGKLLTGRVHPLLVFESHVVLNMGGRYGTPLVCNDANYVRCSREPTNGTCEA